MAQDVPLYNEAVTIHRRGPLDIGLLERSFDEILHRHESWRSSFALVDGEVMQIVAEELPHQSAADRSERSAAGRARSRGAAPCHRRCAKAPRSRASAAAACGKSFAWRPRNHRLYLTLHHIIFDGVSLYQVMVPELAAIYARV